MAIARKPNTSNSSSHRAVDVEALIAKGGSVGVSAQDKGNEKGTSAFTFRIPTSLLAKLDEHRKNQPYKVTRQQWLLAAVVHQLEQEASPGEVRVVPEINSKRDGTGL